MDKSLWSFDLPVIVWLLSALALIAAIGIFILLIKRLRAIVKATELSECDTPEGQYPSVSVVVYARDDAANLPILIRQLYAQDYPGKMEVVVVADLSGYDTADVDVVGALTPEFPSLKMTYIPAHSRNLSRKKLAVTLGIKAASMQYVALTCGNCRIPSTGWLRHMMAHTLDGKVKVVVGSSTMRDLDGAPGPHARLRGFDDLWQAARSICGGLEGYPRRATGNNLVYSRSIFFDNGGFASSLNLNFGDDDLFVSEIADGVNTAIDMGPETMVEERVADPVRAHYLDRLHRDFTDRYLPRRPRLAMGLISCCWWVWFAASVAAIILGLPSVIPLVAVTLISLALCIPVIIRWRRAARAMRCCDDAGIMVPWLMLWHPLYNLRYRLSGYRNRRDNFTWNEQ